MQKLNNFLAKHNLDIQVIGYVCTDSAPTILGNKSFFFFVKTGYSALAVTHCFLHRHALALETLPLKLKNFVDNSVKAINWIRGRALNQPLFKSLRLW